MMGPRVRVLVNQGWSRGATLRSDTETWVRRGHESSKGQRENEAEMSSLPREGREEGRLRQRVQ